MADEEMKVIKDSKDIVKEDLSKIMEWYNDTSYIKDKKLFNQRRIEYAKMNAATKEKFRNILKEDLQNKLQEINPGNVVDIIKAHHENITQQKNVMKRIAPYKNVDPELKKMTDNVFGSTIKKGETYLNNIKDSIIKDGKIYNINALGDIFMEMQKDGNTKEVNKYMKNLLKDVDLSELKESQMKDFIKKTFRADATDATQVTDYLGQIHKNFGINKNKKGSAFFESMENILNTEGNKLKKLGVRTHAVESIGKGLGKIAGVTVGTVLGSFKAGSAVNNLINKRSIKKMQKRSQKALAKSVVEETNSVSDLMRGKKGLIGGVLLNSVIALGEYKEGRKEGRTVLGSAGNAAASMIKGEILGMGGMLALGAIKGTGKLAVKGTMAAMEMSRSMNNLQRFTPFADAHFQDTQQLATMRQSGMELAKMSQYNLQQTLMGTEAKYLHR